MLVPVARSGVFAPLSIHGTEGSRLCSPSFWPPNNKEGKLDLILFEPGKPVVTLGFFLSLLAAQSDLRLCGRGILQRPPTFIPGSFVRCEKATNSFSFLSTPFLNGGFCIRFDLGRNCCLCVAQNSCFWFILGAPSPLGSEAKYHLR